MVYHCCLAVIRSRVRILNYILKEWRLHVLPAHVAVFSENSFLSQSKNVAFRLISVFYLYLGVNVQYICMFFSVCIAKRQSVNLSRVCLVFPL